jgi:hypothetical protein
MGEDIEERIVVDVTPAYLIGLFKIHTDVQAQRLVEPYLGTWLTVSGPLGEVMNSTSDTAQVRFERGPSAPLDEISDYFQIFMYFDRQKWDERLAVLTPEARSKCLGDSLR